MDGCLTSNAMVLRYFDIGYVADLHCADLVEHSLSLLGVKTPFVEVDEESFDACWHDRVCDPHFHWVFRVCNLGHSFKHQSDRCGLKPLTGAVY